MTPEQASMWLSAKGHNPVANPPTYAEVVAYLVERTEACAKAVELAFSGHDAAAIIRRLP